VKFPFTCIIGSSVLLCISNTRIKHQGNRSCMEWSLPFSNAFDSNGTQHL